MRIGINDASLINFFIILISLNLSIIKNNIILIKDMTHKS
jgi:hypothetical protein